MQSKSTFMDGLSVSDEAKSAVVVKMQKAMSQATLGRESLTSLNGKNKNKTH
jgi:hypothetical protein